MRIGLAEMDLIVAAVEELNTVAPELAQDCLPATGGRSMSASMPDRVTWWKVPIVGVPGFPGCDVRLRADGQPVEKEGDEVDRICGANTTWMLGEAHVCADHFPLVAAILGDTAEEIERAFNERVD